MNAKGDRPRLRPAFDAGSRAPGFRRAFPPPRSRAAIAVVAVMDIAFVIPAIGALRQAAGGWGNLDTLFDLMGAVFMSAWLLGWSVAPVLLTLVLALLVFGREVVTARPGELRVFIGLPLLGIAARYDPARLRNLRLQTPEPGSGRSWRGSHLAFDYGSGRGEFGSNLHHGDAVELQRQIAAALGAPVADGPPLPHAAASHAAPPPAAVPAPQAGPKPGTGSAAPAAFDSASSLALIIANLVPIAGALFLGWRLGDVMVLYWAESAVIGLFNVCKMAVIGRWLALPAGAFFIGHFGAFMAVHFLFLYGLFIDGPQTTSDPDLATVARLFGALWPALAALFLSHAYSFFANFLGRREYVGRTLQQQMGEPYARIVLMHLTLIFGGMLVMVIGEPAPVLIGVIALKTIVDLRAHRRLHRRRTAAGPEADGRAGQKYQAQRR
ncbi:MAG: DUF6498-containing protein [bacterium]